MNIIEHFKEVRAYTNSLCQPLQKEDYVVQVAEFASPAKWHLAHTSWFFETFVLIPNLKGFEVFDKDFGFLFNSYYNNAGDRVLRANRGNLTRPTVDQVYAYRAYIDEAIIKLLMSNFDSKICDLITLGLNHEQQHQELLLTDIKYMFGKNPLFPVYDANSKLLDNEFNTESGFITIDEGVYEIGYKGNKFCYDNELGVHKVYIHDFEIENRLITNGEYIAFINAGGYSDFNLWLDEGWTWLQNEVINCPLYWHKVNDEWYSYTLEGFIKVNPEAILKHISLYEAMAFAEWKGMRLPTESEWEVAADKLKWGQRWEWTNSAYLPYPKFKKAEGAIGEYNGKFMINQMILKGASIATYPGHSRKSYRNFFHANERWQFTGIRLVK